MVVPKRRIAVTLNVKSARSEDVYKDTIRIAQVDRGTLRTGQVHRVRVGKSKTYAILRGLTGAKAGQVLMDEATRERLGVEFGRDATLEIEQAGFWGSLNWGWNATDPAYAAAARLGVLSFWLGVVSLGLGLCSLILQ